VQAPNVTGSAPGMVLDVYSFDHDLEQFIAQGPARVSSDGFSIVSDPGFGIAKSGWFFQAPPSDPPGCVDPPPPCKTVVGCKVVPDASQNGKPCFDVNPTFTLSGYNISVGPSCQGICDKTGTGECVPDPSLGFGVSQVEAAVQDAINAVSGLGSEPDCVGPGLGLLISNGLALNGLKVSCAPSPGPDGPCGYTPTIGGNTIVLFPAAFNRSTGCSPGATVLHELVHGPGNNPGYPDLAFHNLYGPLNPPAPQDKPYGCERGCFFVSSGTASACKSN